jgi:hypothetical protein
MLSIHSSVPHSHMDYIPSISIEPPTDDYGHMGLADDQIPVDPPCDATRTQFYSSDPTLYGSGLELYGHTTSSPSTVDVAYLNDDINSGSDCDFVQVKSFPGPFLQPESSWSPRHTPDDINSPCSNSSLGDEFPSSPSSYTAPLDSPSPYYHDHSLSPIVNDFQELALTPPVFDHSTSTLRSRSHSVTEGTVAPSDTWRDPDTTTCPTSGSLSAPSTNPSSTSPLPHIVPTDFSQYFNGGNGSFPSNNEINYSYPTYQGGDVPIYPDQIGHQYDAGVVTQSGSNEYLQPHSPVDVVSPSLTLQTDGLDTRNRPSHGRCRSDSYSHLSPTSPVERRRAPASIRHSPYPSSAPSSPNHIGFPPASLPVVGSSLQRRLSSPARPAASLDARRPVDDVLPTQYGSPIRRVRSSSQASFSNGSSRGDTLVQPSQLMLEMLPHPPVHLANEHMPSPALSSSPSSPSFKDVVASDKIVQASNLRRRREAKHQCEHCGQTFTAKHNLQNHIYSHTGVRPFKCPECSQTFVTSGVLNRHRTSGACAEGKPKQRKHRSSVSSNASSAHSGSE